MINILLNYLVYSLSLIINLRVEHSKRYNSRYANIIKVRLEFIYNLILH